ncbi:MAG: phosphoesterase [Bacteroidetes bacterium 43-16]|uniref:metallophosphoesterase n=1 Tax=uncultured Dysgonomonas sp. TaxID=206096 RepID=UPI000925D05F|nr:metallophosphoesterase [uncultured Dysgonomonas sp.]OJV50953.1 MAG: phosphoesterase [Bacteroidetes bacterium 43-16]
MENQKRKTFVMGDIHGDNIALEQCLQRSGIDYENDQLIQLGDVVDRNDGVYECVEQLLKIKHLIAIKGNHDNWLLDFIETDYHPISWAHGGNNTIISYLNHTDKKGVCIPRGNGYKTSLNSSDIPASHQEFFRNQELYYIDEENRCFVHAGFNRYIGFEQQKESSYYWDRDLWTDALSSLEEKPPKEIYETITVFKEIYIGHTPTTAWETDKPMNAFNIYNLDTGAGNGGRLTIMDIDTKEYWQSDKKA